MLWLFLACKSDPEKQEEVEEGEIVVQQDKEVVEHPILAVNVPSRGQFILGDGISVQGTVQEATAPLSKLTVNDEELTIDGDSFEATVSGRPGVNILNFRLEAEDRGRAVDSVGVYHGPYLEPDEFVEDGVRLQIGQELLDDGDPDVDDLATIAEEVINGLDLTALIGGQAYPVDDYLLTIYEVTHGGVDLSIDCGDTLLVTANLSDLYVNAHIDALTGFDGFITVDEVILELELDFMVENGQVEVYVVDRTIEFVNLQSDDWLPWGFGWLEPIIISAVQDEVETAIGDQAQSLIETLVTDYLNNFTLDFELFAGVSLNASISSLDVGEEGLRMGTDARLHGSLVKDVPNGAGSARLAGTPPAWPLTNTRPFAAAVSGDIINQLIFAIWGSGYFDGIEIDGILIQGLSGGAIPEPIGPVDNLEINIGLPPSLHPADLGDMTATLSMGEWQMRFTREDSEIIDFRINLEAGLDVFVENGKVKLQVDNRPAKIDLGVATLEKPEYLDGGDLSALGRLMIPSLLGSVTTFLPAIELPPIPLGSLADGLSDLTIQDADITMTSDSWLLIEANVE